VTWHPACRSNRRKSRTWAKLYH